MAGEAGEAGALGAVPFIEAGQETGASSLRRLDLMGGLLGEFGQLEVLNDTPPSGKRDGLGRSSRRGWKLGNPLTDSLPSGSGAHAASSSLSLIASAGYLADVA